MIIFTRKETELNCIELKTTSSWAVNESLEIRV